MLNLAAYLNADGLQSSNLVHKLRQVNVCLADGDHPVAALCAWALHPEQVLLKVFGHIAIPPSVQVFTFGDQKLAESQVGEG